MLKKSRLIILFTLVLALFLGSLGPSILLVRANNISVRSSVFESDGSYSQLVIGLNEANSTAQTLISSLVGQVGGTVTEKVLMGNTVDAVVAKVPAVNYTFLDKQAKLAGLTRYLEPRIEFQAQFEPNDPFYDNQWAPPKMQANFAWNITRGNSSVLVGIVDTGIDYNHPDLAGNYVALGRDWVDSTNDPLDDNGHGTLVAGIIAASINNGVGVAGLAQVKIMAEKALNSTGWGDDVDIANAITDAVNKGAKILSNSWGSSTDSSLIHDAIQYAYANGVLVVAAAGNSNSNAPFYPAAYHEVISVAATDQFDVKTDFSHYGNWIELSAPGIDVYSTMPTYHVTLNDEGYASNYDYASGTSMACPQVSGVAALVWSEFPNATRDWVREQLRTTADNVGPSLYYGYGRINAFKAVEQAPAAHDIAVFSYQAPTHIEPGDQVQFNVSVLNFGLNTEYNVQVQLLVNGGQTDYGMVPILQSGSSQNLTLTWTPQAEGTYNVTFYSPPVAGDQNLANNVISVIIDVQFLVSVAPTSGPVGTAVTVEGNGFTVNGQVEVSFNDMFIGTASTDSNGSFTFTFNIPVSAADVQLVKATDLVTFGQANFTVMDTTPLTIQVDTGALCFRDEEATFCVQTAFRGQTINSTAINSVLYMPDGESQKLAMQPFTNGMYKAAYTVPNDAQAGLYTLLVTASYANGTIMSEGTSFTSFGVSETLEGWNAVLLGVNGTGGTIRTDLGLMEVDLSQINATVQSIRGDTVTLVTNIGNLTTGPDTLQFKVAAINGTVATLQTILGIVNGTITSIQDQMATIVIPQVGQIQANVTGFRTSSQTWTTLQVSILAAAVTAAAAAIISLIIILYRKPARAITPEPGPPVPEPVVSNPNSPPAT